MAKKKGGNEVTDVAQQAYDATASFGRFMALLSAIGATLFSFVIIGAGIYLLNIKDPYKGKTMATVTAAKCSSKNNTTTCVIDYEYTVNNKTYKQTGYEIQGTYVTGSSINMLYDTANPDNHKLKPMNWKLIGWICIIVGIVIIVISWIWYIITRTYKIAAAATGVDAVADIALDPQ